MCSFYLDLANAPLLLSHGRVDSGAVFPWCAVRARGSFRQSSVLIQHPQRTSRSSGASSWERSCPVLHHPGLEAGRRKTRHVTVSLLVVFKLFVCQETSTRRSGPTLRWHQPGRKDVPAEAGTEFVSMCFPRSGGYRDRTGDIQLAKLALSQLS